MNHAVTSSVQMSDTYSFYARKHALVPLVGQMLKCQPWLSEDPDAYHLLPMYHVHSKFRI